MGLDHRVVALRGQIGTRREERGEADQADDDASVIISSEEPVAKNPKGQFL